MTHTRTLKIAERVSIVAALTTLLLALIYIWGNVISENYTVLSRLLNTSILVLLAAGVITTLTRDLLLTEKHRVLSRLAYLSHDVTVFTTIVTAMILLPITWGLLPVGTILMRIFGSLAAFFLIALLIARISGVSSHRLKGGSAIL